MPKAAKQAAEGLEAALAAIERQHGKGSIMRLSDSPVQAVEVISTGSLALDHALGIGGYPRGRVTEIYGPEMGGKTTLALHAIAECQRSGGTAAFIDAEHSLDPGYAAQVGVDIDALLITQPDTGEQGLEIADTLAKSGAVDIIVIDSVAALVPRAEIEGEMGDSHVGLQARLMSQALRKLTPSLGTTVCIFINQLREKIGVFYGNPEVTPGGKALKFYASVRLDVRAIERLKDGNVPYGNKLRVKVVKNKLAPPFRQAEFALLFGRGIHRSSELLDLGQKYGVILRKGSYYSFGEIPLGGSRAAALEALEAVGTAAAAEGCVRAAMASPALPVPEPPEQLLAGEPDFTLR